MSNPLVKSAWDLEEIIEEGIKGNIPEMSEDDWKHLDDIVCGVDIDSIDPEYFSIEVEEQ